MESHNLQHGTKSISLYNLEKTENNLINKVKKPKLQSSKCSLSRKKTNKLIIKNILDDKKFKDNSKLLNETPNIKQSKKSTNLKTNYSISKIKDIKNKDTNSIGTDKKRIYTINIQLDSKIQKYLKKTKIQKNFYLKSNKKNKTKSNKKNNIKRNQKILEKSKKLNLANTPYKNNINNINYISKPINKNLLFLDISDNSENSKIEDSNNKNKFSKSVIEQQKNSLGNHSNKKRNNILYYKIDNNNIINNIGKTAFNSKVNINIIRNNTDNNCLNDNKKILVIDLDETLIHTSFQKIQNPDFKIQLDSNINRKNSINKNNNNNINDIPMPKQVEAYIRIRPGVDKFLSQMSKYYDIYVYSASSKNYLNTIIKNIDKNNIIKQCYCRDDCIMYVEDYEEDFDKPNNKYNYVKDLKKINKDLRNIVFVDNNTISFKLQEKNGIPIKSWYDDNEDLELYKLIPILKNLSGFYDVRVEISKFVQNKTFIWSKSINWLVENCLNSSYLNEINSVLLKEQKKTENPLCNYNDINMDLNKPKVINNINNILINLNENDKNLKNNKKYLDDKKKKLLKKINTEFEFKTHNFKNIKIYKNNFNNNEDKITQMESNTNRNDKKVNTNHNNNKYPNSNYTQKIQKNLFKKKIVKPNHLIKSSLVHQYSICFSKNNIIDKMNSSQKKQSLRKAKYNDSKIINKYFLENQNRVIVNYINNKKNY